MKENQDFDKLNPISRNGVNVNDFCVCFSHKEINYLLFSGGIKAFSVKEESVLKWCLNRSEQAKNTQDLREMCGLVNDPGIYKPSRPSQISKSEHLVQSVMHILIEEYINPFGFDVEKDELVSLSSGVPLNNDLPTFFYRLTM